MRGIELQTFGRAGANVTLGADRRKNIVLDRLKIRGDRSGRGTARGDGLAVLIETVSIARATHRAASHDPCGPGSESAYPHSRLLAMTTTCSRYPASDPKF